MTVEVISPKPGSISSNNGEALDAFDVTTHLGVGAVATRDSDWMQAKYGMSLLSAAHEAFASRTSYGVGIAQTITVEAAWAWTKNPMTEQEEISSWFAVDKVMQF